MQAATGKPSKLLSPFVVRTPIGLNASSGAALARMHMLHSQDGDADTGPFEPIHP